MQNKPFGASELRYAQILMQFGVQEGLASVQACANRRPPNGPPARISRIGSAF